MKVEEVQMDPIKLHAVRARTASSNVETYDATELFERAGAALSEKRDADAVKSYEDLMKEFPAETRYTKAALYNAACLPRREGLRDGHRALSSSS